LLGESGVSQESTQVEDQDKKHPKLYKLNWLNWDNMVIMNKWCVVLFSIGKRYGIRGGKCWHPKEWGKLLRVKIKIIVFILVYKRKKERKKESMKNHNDLGNDTMCNRSLKVNNGFTKITSVLKNNYWSVLCEWVNYIVPDASPSVLRTCIGFSFNFMFLRLLILIFRFI